MAQSVLVTETELEDVEKTEYKYDWVKKLRTGFSTKSSILKDLIIKPLMGTFRSVDDLQNAVHQVEDDVNVLGFHTLDGAVEPLNSQGTNLQLEVILTKKQRFDLGAYLGAEGEQATGSFQASTRNYFGFLETIAAKYGISSGESVWDVSIEKPLVIRPIRSRSFRVDVGNSNADFSRISSHTKKASSATLSYLQGPHSFSYEASIRDIKLATTATEDMLREGGTNVKSALQYSYVSDTRDNRVIPTRGRKLGIKTEFAGLGGDTAHLKVEGEVQQNKNIGNGFVFHLNGKAGFLLPRGERSKISDRFNIGGMQIPFLGFNTFGLGPREGNDYYGGDLYWTTSLHATVPITPVPFGTLFLHGYAQLGNCVLKKDFASLFDFKGQDKQNPIRSSAGMGVSIATDVGVRLDLLYNVPMAFSEKDKLSRYSFGIAVNF